MRALLCGLGFAVMAGTAGAQCFGTDSFKTCTDAQGNSYTVQKFGNQTIVNGQNPRTGSTWNQSSQTFGNQTFTQGQASHGNSWNMTQQRLGNGTYTYGTDSRGNSFNDFELDRPGPRN